MGCRGRRSSGERRRYLLITMVRLAVDLNLFRGVVLLISIGGVLVAGCLGTLFVV